MFNVLFIDQENSVRSVLAEALLNHWGKDRFRAFSAGIEPKGHINEHAKAVLEAAHLPLHESYSKPLSEFEGEAAESMDFVFVLCDKVHHEALPTWPNHTINAVWDIHSPYSNEGLDGDAIREILHNLEARIQLFINLPIEKLDHLKRQQAVQNL